ncbi:MAG TPA: alcohol dehydrogenase, partial [Candidatus Dormibacteraeota bacterium]
MKAVFVDAGAPERIAFRDVDPPQPAPDEALVEVRAISLNRGELNRIKAAADGWRPGWDIGGVVRQAAATGGPSVGARVVGVLGVAAWAETVAVPVTQLAVLPDQVSFVRAAALPVAGLTALRTLRLGRALLGSRVLVTGASGGVGRFAVQLAHRGGA